MATTLGFAGSGFITPIHALAGRPFGMTPVAWASRDRANAERRAAELGGRAVSYDELPAGADLVIVASPPAQHLEHTRIALEGGAAALVEKPLCTTLEDADALVSLAAQHSDQLFYAENLFFAPVIQHMLQATSAIGPLRHIEARSLNTPAPWLTTTGTDWGGGALFDLGVHPLAVVLLLASVSQPDAARVTSVSCTLTGSHAHPYDDLADLRLMFNTGCTGRVVSSFRETGSAVWDAQASSDNGVVRAEIMPRESLERNGETIAIPAAIHTIPELERFGYINQLAQCAASAAAGTGLFMDARFGRLVLDIVCAAYASAGRNGEAVAVPFTGLRNRTPHELWRG
jgi:myo-inositol 2-dehydrogenase / D-chiro-inositol 1-dehydrogenase